MAVHVEQKKILHLPLGIAIQQRFQSSWIFAGPTSIPVGSRADPAIY
jgi:hypothetical protein